MLKLVDINEDNRIDFAILSIDLRPSLLPHITLPKKEILWKFL